MKIELARPHALDPDDLRARGSGAVEIRLENLRGAAHRAQSVLRARSPQAQVTALTAQLQQLRHRQTRALQASLTRRRQQHARHAHALELLGPRQTLQRGFTITMDQHRRPLTSAAETLQEKDIVTIFADGEITSQPQPPPR